MLRKAALFTSFILVIAASETLVAQTTPDEEKLNVLLEKLTSLEQRVNRLETRLNASGSPDLAARLQSLDGRLAAAPVVVADANGFAVQNNNGDYRLTVGMVAQTDGRFSLDDPKPITNTFTLRKIRPTFSGRVARYFDYKIMPDFGNGTAVVLDAYFDIRVSPKFRVRAGKDKTPIGYELLQGDAFLLFPERALASSLVPNRDIGIQAQGDLAGGKVFYAAGVFNGIPDGTSVSTELDLNSSKDLAGRVVIQPFRSTAAATGPLNGLGFQIGGSAGKQSGSLPSFRTSVGQIFFSYNSSALASGERRRVSPALFYYYKALGVFGEYMYSRQAVTRTSTQANLANRAWEVTASYVLTGEPAGERGIRPRNNFDPARGRWGALQLVGRYTTLRVDRDAFALGFAAANASHEAKSFTVGANWYPAGFIKQYLTFERTTFNGPVVRPAENVVLVRSQLAF